METTLLIALFLSIPSLLAWTWLILARSQFWPTDQRLAVGPGEVPADYPWPSVSVVVPARNEAEVLPQTLPTLLGQNYPGRFHICLVDDHSDNGTGHVALKLAGPLAPTLQRVL